MARWEMLMVDGGNERMGDVAIWLGRILHRDIY